MNDVHVVAGFHVFVLLALTMCSRVEDLASFVLLVNCDEVG